MMFAGALKLLFMRYHCWRLFVWTFVKRNTPNSSSVFRFIILWLLLILQRCSDSLRGINTMTQVDICVRPVSNKSSSTERLTADDLRFFPVMILGAS